GRPDPRQPFQRVTYLLLLINQLCRIIQMLPFASSADTEMRAERFRPVGGRPDQPVEPSFKKRFLPAVQRHIGDIARYSLVDKKHPSFRFPDPPPVFGNVNDLQPANSFRLL